MQTDLKDRIGDEDEPRYGVKLASRLTGIPAVTLRAWERRYGVPAPYRESQGYRLYSERDIHTLRWLKQQTEAGITIKRAVDRLRRTPRQTAASPAATADRPASLDYFRRELQAALLGLDDVRAVERLRLAFSLYPIDQVLESVIRPALVEIGEAWHRGEIPIATEHFASQLCRQQVIGLAAGAPAPWRDGSLLVAAAPGEQHEIGLLMLVAELRLRGWDVKYLGQDLPLDRLEEVVARWRPALVVFSATSGETLRRLLDGLPGWLERLGELRPRVLIGGQAVTTGGEPLPGVITSTARSGIAGVVEAVLEASHGRLQEAGP